jgi:hypothetical protein
LQALDCNGLFDRLKLAAYYALRELKNEMEAKVALRGIMNFVDGTQKLVF